MLSCSVFRKVIPLHRKQAKTGNSFPSLSRRGTQTTLHPGENRFIFKRRLFKNTRELSQDPVEINMLYAQAVYSVVKVNFDFFKKIIAIVGLNFQADDFPVSEKVALQLAGLQAQVALGDPQPDNNKANDYYADVLTYLPKRIASTRNEDAWVR